MSNAGLITSYMSNTDGTKIQLFDQSTVPDSFSGVYVDSINFNNAFYCSRGKEARDRIYKSNNGPWCTFHDDLAVSVKQYTDQAIIVNNVQYVQNIVQQNITETFTSAGFADPTESLTKINSDIQTLYGTAASLQTMLDNQNVILNADTTQLYSNSNQIANMNIKLNQIISLLKTLNVLSLSNGNFNQNLNIF